MTSIALFGAGGKMGRRLSKNLAGTEFNVRHVEVSAAGRDGLKEELGIDTVEPDVALDGADVVILAVPDTLIGKVSHGISDKLKSGVMVIVLDAAAPFAGHLPQRDDLTYFVTHPCHPSIFNDEPELDKMRDFFGGSKARQNVVSALMQGPEEAFSLGERIARTIYAPVGRSHRVTVDQMALLEPGLSETVCATLLAGMREAMDDVVARGVPKETARDFLLGHMNILSAVIFEEVDGAFSDACNKAMTLAQPQIFQPDWKRVLDKKNIEETIRLIT